MTDQQHSLAGIGLMQALDRRQHPRRKRRNRLTLGRRETIGVGPESPQGIRIGLHQRRRAPPFPSAEVQFLQILVQHHWQL
ncbi:hypothetical protein D3C71_1898200 [compost metagenome]